MAVRNTAWATRVTWLVLALGLLLGLPTPALQSGEPAPDELAEVRRALDAGETLEAIARIEAMHEGDGGESAESNYLLGLALQRRVDEVGLLGKRKVSRQLRQALERALELDPAHLGAHEELADFYYFAPGIVGGSRKKAAAQIEILESISAVDALRVRGRYSYNGGEYRDAERYFTQALSLDSRRPELWYLRGLARRQQLEKDGPALDDFERALELGYDDPVIHYQLGRLCVRLETCPERGERSLRTFIEQAEGRNRAFGHYRLAQLLEQRALLGQARSEAVAALGLEPDLEEARFLLERVEQSLRASAP